MRIRHRYGLSSFNKHLLRFLNKNKIPYQSDELTITVEVFEDDEQFDIIELFMRENDAVDVISAIYGQTELDNSKWLSLKSEWWSQYPEPQNNAGYLFTTYDVTEFCKGTDDGYYCGKGLRQAHPFVIARKPNWGARNFMMLNWVSDELFVSQKTFKILQDSGLTGFSLWNVMNKQQIPYDNVKQLYVETQLPKGVDRQSIAQVCVCPNCGFEKYITKPGPVRFKKELFYDLKCDIVRTTDKFGERGCDSMILVSKEFYRVVINNKLDRGLIFEPIELI